MKPFNDFELRNVINEKWAAIDSKIEAITNEVIMTNDLQVLAENIYQEFYIEPVEIFEEDFSKRSIKQGKIKKRIDPFFQDFYGRDYTEVDGIIATFSFPYIGDSILFRCRASTFSLGVYPEITISKNTVSFCLECSLSEMTDDSAKDKLYESLNKMVKQISDGLSYANKDAESFNNSLISRAIIKLGEKKKKVEAFYSASALLEVPTEKKKYIQNHIPIKRNITPINKSYESKQYYDIRDEDYKDILETIKHTMSTCERTPSSYKSLNEEGFRNILLASLNAHYKGDATGETFRNKGKTDICIEHDNRAAFVAECKIWTGQKEVSEAIKQLDRYLTWRDCKVALIYFVRRKDFLGTIESVEPALRGYENMKNVKEIDKNEYDCLYLSSSNPGQQVKMRVMLFNLYCEE